MPKSTKAPGTSAHSGAITSTEALNTIRATWRKFLLNAVAEGVTHAIENDEHARTMGIEVKKLETAREVIVTVPIAGGTQSITIEIPIK